MADTGHTPSGRRRPAVAGERKVRARPPSGSAASPPARTSPSVTRTSAATSAPAPAYDGKPAPERGRRRGRLPVVVGALLVSSLVLAGLTAFFLVSINTRNQSDRASAAALNAARASAVDLLSYDYHHLDADFTKAKTHLTGPFAQEYADTSTKVVQPTATEFQAVVSAAVTGAAVKTASARSAVVLVFVDQTSSNTKVPAPHIDQNRVRMTLTNVRGRWLVSKLEAL